MRVRVRIRSGVCHGPNSGGHLQTDEDRVGAIEMVFDRHLANSKCGTRGKWSVVSGKE